VGPGAVEGDVRALLQRSLDIKARTAKIIPGHSNQRAI
jgi:hypothetical protein